MLLKFIPLFFMLHGICTSRPMDSNNSWEEAQKKAVNDFFSMNTRPYQPPQEAPEIKITTVIGSPKHEFGPGQGQYPVSEKQRAKDRKASSSKR